ncbi:MAG: hypothetical protein AAF514_07295 [Verrucomicrobiota bacterium]
MSSEPGEFVRPGYLSQQLRQEAENVVSQLSLDQKWGVGLDKAASKVLRKFRLVPAGGGVAVRIRDTDGEMAVEIANALVSSLVATRQSDRREWMRMAERSIGEQIREMENELELVRDRGGESQIMERLKKSVDVLRSKQSELSEALVLPVEFADRAEPVERRPGLLGALLGGVIGLVVCWCVSKRRHGPNRESQAT